jgi:hypothetical protein
MLFYEHLALTRVALRTLPGFRPPLLTQCPSLKAGLFQFLWRDRNDQQLSVVIVAVPEGDL